MAIARFSKSRGRKPLQVRVLHPPHFFALYLLPFLSILIAYLTFLLLRRSCKSEGELLKESPSGVR